LQNANTDKKQRRITSNVRAFLENASKKKGPIPYVTVSYFEDVKDRVIIFEAKFPKGPVIV
ncbi:MAG: hypothetical protein CYPHOPRED_004868, partial [Cyphobasidiales sp. Tagirdzhanova-0007]